MGVIVIDHPLVNHKLSQLRSEETGTKVFRRLTNELAGFLFYEATRRGHVSSYDIKTPIARAKGVRLSRGVTFVPVLRAGLGMLDAPMELAPDANVGHIGLYRDPVSLSPVLYYCKLPDDIEERDVYLLDPMCATGGSAKDAANMLLTSGAARVTMLNIICSKAGVKVFTQAMPTVDIYTCAVDEELNSHGYIVPGLGDAGDRLFGTK